MCKNILHCETEHSCVLSNNKEAERRARNRKYQRNYHAKFSRSKKLASSGMFISTKLISYPLCWFT